ncbi:MAG TPA: GAF domain-containing protein [Terriglobales bacterium]|jgi:GAF domain-containing protein|nr:GAF domain-containing protein [Terriglobales bacterium]
MPSTHQQLAKELSEIADAAPSVEELMSIIVGRLRERLQQYNWVGFYMIEKGRHGEEAMLVLGPYVGAVTPHTRIPLNQGICGAAASSGHTVIVDDVNADPRYLACSIETKSEIVVPVRVKGAVVGELDIDSHTPAAFRADDRQLVEHCARLVGLYLEKATGQAQQ